MTYIPVTVDKMGYGHFSQKGRNILEHVTFVSTDSPSINHAAVCLDAADGLSFWQDGYAIVL